MSNLPKIVARKPRGASFDEIECSLSAKGFHCPFCRGVVKPAGAGRCRSARCGATIHVLVNGEELERDEKPRKDAMIE